MDSQVALVAIFIPITAILSIVGLITILRKFKNDERMAMIEKGMVLPQKQPMKIDPAGIMIPGFLFVGAGIGLIIAEFVSSNFPDGAVAIYFGLILLFGGLGLLVAYFIQYKLSEKQRKNNQE
jgi:phosphatidylglycerophosphate synthase